MNSISSRANYALPESRPKRGLQRLLAAIVAVFLAMAGVVTTAGAATAFNPDDDAFGITLASDSGKHNDLPVLVEGGKYALKLHYNPENVTEENKVIEIALPDWVKLESDNFNLEKNQAIKSMVRGADGPLVVTLYTPAELEELGVSVVVGIFELNIEVGSVDVSSEEKIEWNTGGDPSVFEIIVKGKDDELASFEEETSKTPNSPDLSNLLTVDPDADEGQWVSLTEEDRQELLNEVITYTLKVNTREDIVDYKIVDTLGDYLKFADSDVTATIQQWDSQGLNKTDGNFTAFEQTLGATTPSSLTLDFTETVTAPAKLNFTVKAQIDEQQLDGLLEALNAKYKETDHIDGGSYEIALTNSALFGDNKQPKNAQTIIGGQRDALPGPGAGVGLNKTNDIKDIESVDVEETLLEDGSKKLVSPKPVNYTIGVDLTKMKPGTNPKQEITSPVIVTDTLPAGVEFVGPITVTDMTDQANPVAVSVSESTGNPGVNQYRVTGQKFELNLGVTYKAYKIEFPARLVSVNGKTNDSVIFEQYNLRNTVNLAFTVKHTTENFDGKYSGVKHSDFKVDVELFPTGPVEEESTFSKNAPSGAIKVEPGQSALIPFTFTANRVDIKNSVITDKLDNKVFGSFDRYEPLMEISGKVNSVDVSKADFEINETDEGGFTLKLTDDAKGKLELKGKDNISLTIKIPTVQIVGSGSIWVNNTAELSGSSFEYVLNSETSAIGSSRGSELEVRKTVWDEDEDAWQSIMKVDPESIEGSDYFFRIQFIAHGNFANNAIPTISDFLPEGMDFAGFVKAPNGAVIPGNTVDINPGNLVAEYTPAGQDSGEVIRIKAKSGGISGDTNIQLVFKVKISDASENVPLVNKVLNSSGTIVPSDDYPLDIAKLDSEQPSNIVIDDKDAEFELLAQDKETSVLTGLFVRDGKLVQDLNGVVQIPVVTKPGTYFLKEITPPQGYHISTELLEIVVKEKSTVVETEFFNDPIPAYAVGDFTWVDTDRNGIQDSNEPVLKGVTVTITDENGAVVQDIFGEDVAAVETDDKGFYLFDQLPEGKYKVHFALTDEQKEKYSFTKQVQDNLATDSNADTASENYGWSVPFELGDKNENVISQKEYKQIVGEEGQTFEARKGIDPTWDAGVITKKVSVGDYVWFDKNGNGIQDEEGTGIDGVVLKLWKVVGEEVTPVEVDGQQLTEITAEGGEYLFENLPALKAGEKYRVTIDYDHESTISALEPYVPTTPGAGEDREADSSTDFSDSIIDLVADGTHDPSLDFGFVLQSVTVGDYVWFDKDRDGRQDDDERGIKDVLLKIYGPDGELVTEDVFGNEVEPQRTDENGKYLFPHLPVLKEGESYKVVIDREDEKTQGALELYAPTTSNEGDREGDSDTWEAKSQGLTKDGQEDLTLDFGFVVKSYAIGDVVWIDSNRDGLQDEGEEPLEGVAVTLYRVVDGEDVKVTEDIAGDEFGDVETNSEGRYIFDNLPAGTYKVHFELTEAQKNTFSFTIADAKTEVEGVVADEVDSDADQKTGWTIQVVLDDSNEALTKEYDIEGGFKATQGIDPTWDAGVIYKKVSVGDYVWYDFNADGIQDKDEAGIDGVVLKLWKVVGDEVTPVEVDGQQLTEITAEGGEYLFENLPALKAGEKYRVTIDYDHESTINALEPYVPTTPGAGEDREADSSTDFSDSIIDLVVDGTHDPSLDFGFVLKKVSVGDFVWFDKNRDGAQDEGEPGIPGVVLELVGPDGKPVTDVFGEPVDLVTTGENGEYTFENLPVLKGEEVYTVVIVEEDPSTVEALKPYVPTYEEGAERDKDSSTWESESLTLTKDGERDDTLDFGFILKSYGIGDVVWIDSNNNGLQDYETEEPLSGVTVTLFRVLEDGTLEVVTEDIDGDVVEPQVTDEDGWYMFDYLPAGNYQVQFELTDEQATKYIFTSYVSGDDDSIDSNANPTTGFTDVIALNDDNENLDLEYLEGDFGASEGIDPTWDAGVVVKTYAIGDIVWVDTNRDGIQGETEVLEGVTVTLLNDKGDVITSTKTDKNGRYIFDVLPAGDYQVKFELTKEQAAKYKFTSVNSGKDAKADSDADLGTGLTKVFKLDDNSAGLTTDYKDQAFEANQGIDPTWDAGVVLKSVSVGDFVWEDKDGNGRQDKGEPGIPGVVLEVTGPDGKPVTDVYGNPVKPATTDKDGKYTFENLPVLEPGQCYTVTINRKESAKALEKYLPTKSGAGDRGGDSSTWTVCSEGLTEDGERDDTLDFGFVLNPEFLAVTGTNLLVPVSVATLALGAGAYLVLRNRKTGSRRA